MFEPFGVIFALLLSVQEQPNDKDAAAAASESVTEASVTPQSASAEVARDDDDKVVCRRTAVIGSRFTKRLCATKKEWDALEARGRETTQNWQRRGKGLEPNDSNKPGG